MSEIVLKVEHLEFHADSRDDEPRVLDIAIGERVGLARPRTIRDVIKKHIDNGFINDSDVRRSERQTTTKGGRPCTEYWLTETGALKVITKLETPQAHALVGEMIRVYREAIRLLRDPPRSEKRRKIKDGFDAVRAACKTVGETPAWRGEIFGQIKNGAKISGCSWQRMHGALRKHLGVISYLRIPAGLLDEARSYLHKFWSGSLMLPPMATKNAFEKCTDKRQQELPFFRNRNGLRVIK